MRWYFQENGVTETINRRETRRSARGCAEASFGAAQPCRTESDFAFPSLQNCTHRACCDPLLCRLKPGAVCGSGGCCTQSCKVRANPHLITAPQLFSWNKIHISKGWKTSLITLSWQFDDTLVQWYSLHTLAPFSNLSLPVPSCVSFLKFLLS